MHPLIYRVGASFPGGITHVYVVRAENTALIDTGIVSSPEVDIAPALRSLGLRLGDVDFVLNTHGHHDHIGGNSAVKKASGADVLMHESDLPYARGIEHQAASHRASYELLGFGPLGAERAAAIVALVGESVGVDRVLADGDVIDLGRDAKIQVVHTPGHTAGSVCFYWESQRVLFSGDAVQGRGSRAGGLPLYESPREYVGSLRRLRELDIQVLLMGHHFTWPGPLATAERMGSEVSETLDESRRVSLAIEDALKRALAEYPDGSSLEHARLAMSYLAYEVPILLDRATGLPRHGVGTLAAHLSSRHDSTES